MKRFAFYYNNINLWKASINGLNLIYNIGKKILEEQKTDKNSIAKVCVSVYIYVYTHTHTYILQKLAEFRAKRKIAKYLNSYFSRQCQNGKQIQEIMLKFISNKRNAMKTIIWYC